MASPKKPPETQNPPPSAILVQPLSPRYPTTSLSHRRRIAIAVDLSDESAHAVRWAVTNYLRPATYSVTLLHVRPTSVLYGADWGPTLDHHTTEDEFDVFTASKAADLARPLAEAGIPYKIHIVKDHDMKERLCFEVERLGPSAVIIGSRGFGATAAARRDVGEAGERE